MGLMSVLLAMAFTLPAYGSIYYDKTVSAYLSGTGQKGSASINVSGFAKGKGIVKSSVKSSNDKVVRADTISNSTRVSTKLNKYGTSGTSTYGDIELTLLKAGTAKVSYTVGSKKFTTIVKALKYVNPLKSLVIPGVNGGKSVAGKFKSSSIASGKSGKKAGKIVATAATGWKITYISYDNNATNKAWDHMVFNGTGVAKATLSVPEKIGKGSVMVNLKNAKTQGTLSIRYSLS
jgi:hypothetical protein